MKRTPAEARALFSALLSPDEQLTMNLFHLILSDEQALPTVIRGGMR